MSDLNVERECLALANKLIVQCQLPHPRIMKLSALSYQLIMMLYRACCGLQVSGLIKNPRTREEEVFNVQAAIDALSHHVLLTSLAHIEGRSVVAGSPHAVFDLLEILSGCLDLQGASSSSLSSSSSLAASSPDSPILTSSSGQNSRRNFCRRCYGESNITSHSTATSSDSPDSCSLHSETSCFLCDYVRAKMRIATTVPLPRVGLDQPLQRRPMSDSPSPLASTDYMMAESGLDEIDAEKFADGNASCHRPGAALGGRRQGSPYWLRSMPKHEEREPAESESSMEERLKATLAELRWRLVAASERVDKERPVRKQPRTVKKSVLLSSSVRGVKRSRSSSSRKQLQPDADVLPEVEFSSGANTSPHAERVLRRLHDQHVRFAVHAASSASDVAADADQLRRKHEELLQRHECKMEALQKALAHSRRLNELDTQRQLHHTIDTLENDRRQQAARLKRHHDERDRIMRSRQLSHRHRQQQMLREAFKKSIQTRKADLADIRATVRERQLRERDHHRVYLASLENFYQTQLSLLTESLAKEKIELKQCAAAQSKVLERMRRDFKEQLEAETQSLYDLVAQPQDGRVSTSQAAPRRKRSRRT